MYEGLANGAEPAYATETEYVADRLACCTQGKYFYYKSLDLENEGTPENVKTMAE